jgi:hypothetical protein
MVQRSAAARTVKGRRPAAGVATAASAAWAAFAVVRCVAVVQGAKVVAAALRAAWRPAEVPADAWPRAAAWTDGAAARQVLPAQGPGLLHHGLLHLDLRPFPDRDRPAQCRQAGPRS